MKTATLLLVLPLLAAACATTARRAVDDPEAVARSVVAALDEDRHVTAAEAFEPVAADPEARERAYPVLYETARERYEAGDVEGALRVLRFMAEQWPQAVAVHEAYVYALFRQRAETDDPAPELVDEIGDALATLSELAPDGPPWAHLVRTQQAIDRERLADARTSFDAFLSRWNGNPATLVPYLEDIDRYLRTH